MSNGADSETVSCEWLEISFKLSCGLFYVFSRGRLLSLHDIFPWTLTFTSMHSLKGAVRVQSVPYSKALYLTSVNPDFSQCFTSIR